MDRGALWKHIFRKCYRIALWKHIFRKGYFHDSITDRKQCFACREGFTRTTKHNHRLVFKITHALEHLPGFLNKPIRVIPVPHQFSVFTIVNPDTVIWEQLWEEIIHLTSNVQYKSNSKVTQLSKIWRVIFGSLKWTIATVTSIIWSFRTQTTKYKEG